MQLLGKLKISKNKKFHNFSETTTDDAGNADKKTAGSAREREPALQQKGLRGFPRSPHVGGYFLCFRYYGHGAGGKYLRGRQTPVGKRAYQNRVASSFSIKL